MQGREGLYGRPGVGCARIPSQVSTGIRTRATIKALPPHPALAPTEFDGFFLG